VLLLFCCFLQLACFPGKSTITDEAQAVRTECGGTIAVSENGLAAYDWQSLLLDKMQLRYTLMEIDPLPDSLGEVRNCRMGALTKAVQWI
jgi:hypothetical protein